MPAPALRSTSAPRHGAARWRAALGAAALWLLAACSTPRLPQSPGVVAGAPIAVTAHPLATQAALQMMARGGSVADAAVAAQMVLGLVEPQSSGLGGGTLALLWDAGTAELSGLDGLAAAPAQATAGLGIDIDGQRLPAEAVRRGGRSVGVPGTPALLWQLHQQHGRLPWHTLFEPAIALAEGGFAMPRYLHEVLAATPFASLGAPLRALYFDAEGRLRPPGASLTNVAYAQTLRAVAERGTAGWLQAGAAARLAEATHVGAAPGLIAAADVLAYRVAASPPLCRPALRHRVCTTGPASFGGVAVLQTLRIAEAAASMPAATTPATTQESAREPGRQTAPALDLDDPAFVHRYIEAGRLAQADRQRYLGDPAFVTVPLDALLDARYLEQRAQHIDAQRAMGTVAAGVVAPSTATLPDATEPSDATSQMAFVDAQGNALSMTTTVNLNFGSGLMVDGYVLNNAMTNFAAAPPPGQLRANQMAPGKRPITSMAPTIVFDAAGQPLLVGGSAGGGPIVDYIATSLIDLLAAGRSPAQALARGHVSTAVDGLVLLEQGTPAAALAEPLRAQGHAVLLTELKSGLAFLKRERGRWIGAADPRRDGAVLGLPGLP